MTDALRIGASRYEIVVPLFSRPHGQELRTLRQCILSPFCQNRIATSLLRSPHRYGPHNLTKTLTFISPWTKYFTMATPGPQPTPQQLAQIQAQFMEEAKRRGLTPQQFQEQQRQQRQQLAAEAAKQGLTLEQYVAQLKMRAMQEHQLRQHQAQHAQAQGQQPPQQGQIQQIPVNPNAEKKPEAVAVAKFLRSQDLKTRVCILDGQRKDMFKGTD